MCSCSFVMHNCCIYSMCKPSIDSISDYGHLKFARKGQPSQFHGDWCDKIKITLSSVETCLCAFPNRFYGIL